MSTCTGEIKSKNITLVLTHQCNLNCTYCYEHHKDGATMSPEMARDIIEKELTMDDGTTLIEFDLFGGEPLLEFDTVKAIVDYFKVREYDKDYIFFITTNGVLLDEARKKWLRENTEHLQLGLSLDGTKAMHDRNRSDSFDDIDLDFFRTTYPEESVKMTISRETLPNLAEGVIFCHEQGFEVSCNLAYGIDWDNEENQRIFERELALLIDYYIKNPTVKPAAILDINRIKSLAEEQETVRYCGAGYAMRAYDCDGTYYPCQFFLPICVGEEEAKRALTLDFSAGRIKTEQMDKECQSCFIKNVCPTCYGNNYATTGDIDRRDMRLCNLNKIQFKAIAYFAAKRFEHGQDGGFSKADMAAILKASLALMQALQ